MCGVRTGVRLLVAGPVPRRESEKVSYTDRPTRRTHHVVAHTKLSSYFLLERCFL